MARNFSLSTAKYCRPLKEQDTLTFIFTKREIDILEVPRIKKIKCPYCIYWQVDFFFKDNVSLCSLGWPGTSYIVV